MVKNVGMEPVPAWGPLTGRATLPDVCYGAGVLRGAVLSCALLNLNLNVVVFCVRQNYN